MPDRRKLPSRTRCRPCASVTGRWALTLLAAGACWSSGSRFAAAQPFGFNQFPGQDAGEQAELLRKRREARNQRLEALLHQAQQVQGENPERALDTVQAILDAAEDAPIHDGRSDSLKDSAELLILANPKLLELYERRAGAVARALEERGSRDGNSTQLREIAQRYALTEAGLDATWRLAVGAFDDGDSRTVWRWCQRLFRHPRASARFDPRLSLLAAWSARQLGDPAAAIERLADLKTRLPAGLTIDGRTLPWYSGDESAGAWLDRMLPRGSSEPAEGLPAWKLVNGDRHRNGAAPEAPPFLDDGWTYALQDKYDNRNTENLQMLSRISGEVARKASQAPAAPLPTAAPLVVAGHVLFAGYGSIKSVRLDTGEFEWSTVPVDDTLKQLFADDDSFIAQNKERLTELFVGQRGFRDFVDCSISTDGQHVYRVAHGGFVGLASPFGSRATSIGSISPLYPRDYNRLQAYALDGGCMRWDIGGPPPRLKAPLGGIGDAFDLSGAFFCGAPIPWSGELLCIIEQKEQIRLLSLDPASGQPLWSQGLLASDRDLLSSPDRRFAGIVPALDGSVLTASVGNGTIVAFDVAQRRWMWSYTYRDPQPFDARAAVQFRLQARRSNADQTSLGSLLEIDEWLDPRILVAGSRVLATPCDSDKLTCLDLGTGRALWEVPRERGLFLAGVHQNSAIVIAQSEIRAINLQDGSRLWTTAVPQASGRGVRMASRYTLPTVTAEMVTVDLDTGRVLARSQLSSGRAAGNLVAAPGVLISQSASEIRSFRTQESILQDVQQRLAEHPDDHQALALRGELRLHQGDVLAAEHDLEQAAESADSRTRHALAWSLVSGLDRDFGRYYPRLEEIERLSTDPSLRSEAWQHVAQGLERAGDLAGALLALVRAAETMDGEADRLRDWGNSLRLREHCRLAGLAMDLWEQLPAGARPAAAARIAEHLQELPAMSVEQALAVLPRQALPAAFEIERLETLPEFSYDSEQRLLELWRSPDETIAARAGLQLIRVALAHSQTPLAPAILHDLGGRLGDVRIDESHTVDELLAALLDSPAAAGRPPVANWPAGEPEITMLAGEPTAIPEFQNTIAFGGDGSELLAGWTFATDSSTTSLSACDARGAFRWKENLVARGATLQPRISVNGRLVLIELPDSFRIIDGATGQLLRSVSLWGDSVDMFQARMFVRGSGVVRFPVSRPVGPLSADFLAYVEATRTGAPDRDLDARLVVVDPISGRELWSRRVRGAKAVFSDDDFVVVANESGELIRFRARDGRELGADRLPEGWSPERNEEYRNGVRMLLRRSDNSQIELGMYHAGRKEFDWQLPISRLSEFTVVDDRDLAVVNPEGNFTLYDGLSGRPLLTSALEPEPELNRLIVMPDGDRLLIAVSRKILIGVGGTTPQITNQLIDGTLYCLNRNTGDRMWSHIVPQLAVDPSQPGGWPFLVIANWRRRWEADAGGGTRDNRHTAVQLLDRESGRVLYDGELPTSREYPRGWKVDLAAGDLTLRFGESGLQLKYPAAAATGEDRTPDGARSTIDAEPAPPPPVAKPLP